MKAAAMAPGARSIAIWHLPILISPPNFPIYFRSTPDKSDLLPINPPINVRQTPDKLPINLRSTPDKLPINLPIYGAPPSGLVAQGAVRARRSVAARRASLYFFSGMRSIRRAASVGVCRESAVAAGRPPGGPPEAMFHTRSVNQRRTMENSMLHDAAYPLLSVPVASNYLKVYWVWRFIDFHPHNQA